MRLRSVIFSLALHFGVIFSFSIGFFWSAKKDIIVPPPIMVEIVEIAEKTQTTEKPEPIKPKPVKKDRPKPAPVNENTEAAAPALPDHSKAEAKPEKEEVKEVLYKPKKPLKKPKPPKPKIVKKQPPKKVEDKPKPKEKVDDDFASVLKNLALPGQEKAKKQDEAQEKKTSQNVPLGDRITIAEEDALRRQLERCWNVPIGARDIDRMNIEVRLFVNPDKSLRKAEIVDTVRYNTDANFRSVADSAKRAAHICSPLALPDGKFETWKVTTVNFNAKDMF